MTLVLCLKLTLQVSDTLLLPIHQRFAYLKGAAKFYFTQYACVVIILFNTDLYKPSYSADSFEKLAFCLSALRQIEFNVILINFLTFALHKQMLQDF